MNWITVLRITGFPVLINLDMVTHITTDEHGDTMIWFGDNGIQVKASIKELSTLIWNMQKEKKQ